MMKSILLTGANGNLGKNILHSMDNFSFLSPDRKELDICSKDLVDSYFKKNSFDAVIHCAALARMGECEANPDQAFETNTLGTLNLVNGIIEIERSKNKSIRFIYISTDGVYKCDTGNYSENSPTIPYNTYGWSKLGGELTVQMLNNFCIIRTRFFDPKNIPFNESADDIITSSIEIEKLIKNIQFLTDDKFNGIINIGDKKSSEFDRYNPFKPELKRCKRADIVKNLKFEIAKNASMDISLMKKIIKL